MQYFIADTHFLDSHLLGIDKFAPRPFDNVDDMDDAIINNWNKRVKPSDTVYHLGDIAVHYTHPPKESYRLVFNILKQLNGHLILIKGNHDSRALFKYLNEHNFSFDGAPKFQFHNVGALIKWNHCQYYMTHYPMMLGVVNQIINLHGHIHHYSVPIKENINIGVDTPGKMYLKDSFPFGTPFSMDEISQMIKGKEKDLDKMRKGSKND